MEEGIVEFVDDMVIQHIGMVNVGQPFQRAAVGMVIPINVESCDTSLHVIAGDKLLPELGRRIGTSYTTCHADDGNIGCDWRSHGVKIWFREG